MKENFVEHKQIEKRKKQLMVIVKVTYVLLERAKQAEHIIIGN